MGIVKKTFENSLGEVTSAVVMKGNTREDVYRHVASLIPLLHSAFNSDGLRGDNQNSPVDDHQPGRRSSRRAARAANMKIRQFG